jgi:5-methylcytosine-specific restriction endonuclease McrA
MPKAAEYVPYTGPLVTRAEARAAGLKRFFTGEPCKHGHTAQRQTANNQCWGCKKPVTKEYMAAWLAKNPDRRKAISAAYWARNRERYQAYYQQNVERILPRNKAWREANQEAYRRSVNDWHKAHPDRVKAIHRRWVESNPEQVAAHSAATRAKRREAEGRYTVAEVLTLLEKQGGRCVYCGTSIRSKYHADHIVPLARGGSNWISNIQLTCPTCNHRKNRMDPLVFASRLGRLL